MRYRKTVDLWEHMIDEHPLQVGQWVSAGPPTEDRHNVGRFYGVRPSGSVVVAWNGNARQHNWKEYQKVMHTYGKGGR